MNKNLKAYKGVNFAGLSKSGRKFGQGIRKHKNSGSSNISGKYMQTIRSGLSSVDTSYFK